MDNKRIYIIEDDPIIASDLEGILLDLGYSVCGISHQPFDAKKKIELVKPDLLLMDINLNSEIDGIELATLIQNMEIGVIFISAFTDKKTVERTKHVFPLGYILKPFNEKEIEIALELAFNNKPKPDNKPIVEDEYVFIKTKNNTSIKINFKDILVIEAYDNYSFIHTINEKLMVSYTLKEIEQRIKSPSLIRVHRSFIINTSKVDSIQFNLLFVGKYEIPVGKSYKEDVMKLFPSM